MLHHMQPSGCASCELAQAGTCTEWVPGSRECLNMKVVLFHYNDGTDLFDEYDDFTLEWGLWPPFHDDIDSESE